MKGEKTPNRQFNKSLESNHYTNSPPYLDSRLRSNMTEDNIIIPMKLFLVSLNTHNNLCNDKGNPVLIKDVVYIVIIKKLPYFSGSYCLNKTGNNTYEVLDNSKNKRYIIISRVSRAMAKDDVIDLKNHGK